MQEQQTPAVTAAGGGGVLRLLPQCTIPPALSKVLDPEVPLSFASKCHRLSGSNNSLPRILVVSLGGVLYLMDNDKKIKETCALRVEKISIIHDVVAGGAATPSSSSASSGQSGMLLQREGLPALILQMPSPKELSQFLNIAQLCLGEEPEPEHEDSDEPQRTRRLSFRTDTFPESIFSRMKKTRTRKDVMNAALGKGDNSQSAAEEKLERKTSLNALGKHMSKMAAATKLEPKATIRDRQLKQRRDAGEEDSDDEDLLKYRVKRFYAKYAPDLAYKIPGMLVKAHEMGDEGPPRLIATLEAAYGPEPGPENVLDTKSLIWKPPPPPPQQQQQQQQGEGDGDGTGMQQPEPNPIQPDPSQYDEPQPSGSVAQPEPSLGPEAGSQVAQPEEEGIGREMAMPVSLALPQDSMHHGAAQMPGPSLAEYQEQRQQNLEGNSQASITPTTAPDHQSKSETTQQQQTVTPMKQQGQASNSTTPPNRHVNPSAGTSQDMARNIPDWSLGAATTQTKQHGVQGAKKLGAGWSALQNQRGTLAGQGRALDNNSLAAAPPGAVSQTMPQPSSSTTSTVKQQLMTDGTTNDDLNQLRLCLRECASLNQEIAAMEGQLGLYMPKTKSLTGEMRTRRLDMARTQQRNLGLLVSMACMRSLQQRRDEETSAVRRTLDVVQREALLGPSKSKNELSAARRLSEVQPA